MQWRDVEPVLRATYALLADSEHIDGSTVSVAMGRDAGDQKTVRAFEYLDRAGYINASFSMGFALPFLIRATEKGLQQCAGWPSGGASPAFVEAFLRAVDERASAAETEDERSRLRRFGEAASGVGKDLLTDIASKVIEHQAGL